MFDRFRHGWEHYLGLVETLPDADRADRSHDDEHLAVLELLVATMLADTLQTDAELHEIDRFGDEQHWNGPGFSFVQSMGATVAKVRAARLAEGGTAALLTDASSRITTPEVRSSIVGACELVAAADGARQPAEADWLRAVDRAFA